MFTICPETYLLTLSQAVGLRIKVTFSGLGSHEDYEFYSDIYQLFKAFEGGQAKGTEEQKMTRGIVMIQRLLLEKREQTGKHIHI